MDTVETPVVNTTAPVETPAPIAEAPKSRYVNEGRDVLGEAIAKSQLNRETGEITPKEAVSAPVETPPISETPVVSTSTAPVTQDPVRVETPVERKLYAGKFETVEAMEAAYAEAQKAFHTKAQELAEVKKKAEPVPVATPEEIAAKKAAALEKILDDPESVLREARQTAADAIRAEQELNKITSDWETSNKDLVPFKKFVGYEVQSLILQDPDKYANDPAAALAQAGINFRTGVYGTIREEGKKEALQVQASVTPLANSKIQTPPPTEQPVKAPKTQEQAVNEHMEMLKANAARVRRVVR